MAELPLGASFLPIPDSLRSNFSSFPDLSRNLSPLCTSKSTFRTQFSTGITCNPTTLQYLRAELVLPISVTCTTPHAQQFLHKCASLNAGEFTFSGMTNVEPMILEHKVDYLKGLSYGVSCEAGWAVSEKPKQCPPRRECSQPDPETRLDAQRSLWQRLEPCNMMGVQV